MIAIEMPSSSHDFAARILSGQDRSLSVRSLRSLMAITEPIYSTAMLARNAAYDRGILQTRKLPRPTVSVGNITTGGTGKTPVVIWLANRLREAGRRPAVLLRGYRATAGFSDEQQVLNRNLNQNSESEIPVKANPNRIAGAAGVLHHHPNVDTFVLDDAFQHRKVHRNFDLVLINATDPFGYNHVLPRGLLREPLSGLGRATAFLLTRCAQATADEVKRIESELTQRNPAAPIYHADHIHTALINARTGEAEPIDALASQPFYAFAGIGNPAGLHAQLSSLLGRYTGHDWYPDHHAYTEADLAHIRQKAKSANAARILTTEKDWVKIAAFPAALDQDPPIQLLQLGIRFHDADADQLIQRVLSSITKSD